jgi:predicted kinase
MNGYKFNENGEMVPINVYIVYGSPGSGKTTHVKKHMEPGDLIIDLDLIKQSISMSNKTNTEYNLLNTAIKIRELLYSLVESREIECNNVWIVSGLPIKEDRDKLSMRVKADKVIYIEATQEQCIDRAMNDIERTDKELQVRIIDKWFKAYYGE